MSGYIKKVFSVLFCILFALPFLFLYGNALQSQGQCGDNAEFEFDSSTGTLIISGDGAMTSGFSGNNSIKQVYIERGITEICENAFFGCSELSYVQISKTVKMIDDFAFKDCVSLKEISLPNNITRLGAYLFCGCSSLEKIKIPDNVTEIQSGSFDSCTSLKSIIIPKSVVSISPRVFSGCDNLETVYYNGTQDEMNMIKKRDNCFNNAAVNYFTPDVAVSSFYSDGIFTVSLILRKGIINAADIKFIPEGDVKPYRIYVNKHFSSGTNIASGTASMAAYLSLPCESEIASASFYSDSCEGCKITVQFLSCTATVDGFDIDVTPSLDKNVISGSHSFGGYSVSKFPDENNPGICKKICSGCNAESDINLPFAFNKCTAKENLLFVSDCGITCEYFNSKNIIQGEYDIKLNPVKNNICSTGCGVTVSYPDITEINYVVCVRGDTDGDGFIDACDSIFADCIYNGLLNDNLLCKAAVTASDINGDGKTDTEDITTLFYNGLF